MTNHRITYIPLRLEEKPEIDLTHLMDAVACAAIGYTAGIVTILILFWR